jgi:hypothetical protein
MNNENHRPAASDILDEAVGAWRSAPISPGPPPELVAATVGAIENRLASLAKVGAPHQRPRRRVLRYLGYGSLAAAATVLIGVLLSEFGGGTAAAFEQAIEKVAKSDAARFRVRTKFSSPAEQTSNVIIRGNKLRSDGALGPGTAWIIDWDAKGALIIDTTKRAYQTVDMSTGGITPIDFIGINIRDELLALKSQKAQLTGAEMIAGEMADKYAVRGGTAFHTEGDWEVWIGRSSMLPVKVTVNTDLRGIRSTRVFESFDWNAKTDAATFAIDPPVDFEEKTVLGLFPPLPRRKTN